MSGFKMKEAVRNQHRKIVRKAFYLIAGNQSLVNLIIVGFMITGTFDEKMIGALGQELFVVFGFVFPNIVFCLPVLMWFTSDKYRNSIPQKIRTSVARLYEGGQDDDDADAWTKEMNAEIDVLPY